VISDRVVFWAIVVTVVGVWVGFALGWLGNGLQPVAIAIAVTLLATLVGAMQLDWKQRAGAGRHLDQKRRRLYAPMDSYTLQVPTSYIDHPTPTGPPPGVEPYDKRDVEELVGERPTSPDDDPAP
jgi:hypothetical protein